MRGNDFTAEGDKHTRTYIDNVLKRSITLMDAKPNNFVENHLNLFIYMYTYHLHVKNK